MFSKQIIKPYIKELFFRFVKVPARESNNPKSNPIKKIFKNYRNGYHFVDFDKLILNMNLFFQSDLPFGKYRNCVEGGGVCIWDFFVSIESLSQ